MANFPFATIEPNVGIVPVPDERLERLAEVISMDSGSGSGMTGKRPPIVPATVEFVDIAGLIEGAHKGEGLGSKFLHHIREVDAICYVLRAFGDENIVREGSKNPKEDLEILKTELDLADLESEARRESKKSKITEELPFFKNKPVLAVLNVDEGDLKNTDKIESEFAKQASLKKEQVIAICAKLEEELAALQSSEAVVYLNEVGIEKIGLERLIQKAYSTLDLISFLTAGEKEVRAWTLRLGSTSLTAAGQIHTDFMKHFIKADVCDFNDFVESGGWKKCREKGKVRSEGRDYIVRDGDVIEFKIGQ